jgi:hypothetical protein
MSTSADKTLYIHLGFGKTGTSALQDFCHNNRDLLLSRYNLHYPLTGCTQNGCHAAFFPRLQETPWDDSVWCALQEEVAGKPQCGRVLLSSEFILASFLRHPDDCDLWEGRIKQYFPDHCIQFILYVRRIDDWAKSMYNQLVKNYPGRPGQLNPEPAALLSYKNWLVARLRPRKAVGPFWSFTNIFNIIKMATPANTIVRIYDRNVMKNGNILDDFFDIFDIDPAALMPPVAENVNPGLPASSLPLLITALATTPKLPKNILKDIYQKIEKTFTEKQPPAASATLEHDADTLIEAFDRLAPGYKNLFADRPCTFTFPEVEMEPKERVQFDLLFSLYASVADLEHRLHMQHEAIEQLSKSTQTLVEDITNAIQSVPFPNSMQRLVLLFYRPLVKLALPKKQYRVFCKRPAEFISQPNNLPYLWMRRFLGFFGSLPPVGKKSQ